MSEQQLRVLLVEDEWSLREPLAKHLRQTHGYHVETAANGEEALARVEKAQGQFDVVLIDDLLMAGPDLDPEPLGIKLMTEIRARYPHIECILFTGWGMDSGLDALRAGAYRYLAKPFNLEELAVIIEHAAEYRRLKGIAREKQILEQLMETSTALLGGQDLQDVLDTILCGVHAIGFDRVRLYLLSEDRRFMIGQAQAGMDTEFVGLEIPVAADVYMQTLLNDPRPRVFEREKGKPVPYEQQLAKEEVKQWACVPLLLRGEVIGKLSVDNKFSGRPIAEAELGSVALFASQAAAAIENAELMAKEQEASQKAEQRARNLETLQSLALTISSSLELDETLKAACRAAVEFFNADHSGLVLFGPDYAQGEVKAEYPATGTLGTTIPLHEVPAEEGLIKTRQPLVIYDVADDESLGPVRNILLGFDIQSILIVPVVGKDGRVLGSFSLDAVGHLQQFTAEEVELCKVFAAQAAVAIENAQLFDQTQRDLYIVSHLYETSSQLYPAHDLDRSLKLIATSVKEATGALSVSITALDTAGRPYEKAHTGFQEEKRVVRRRGLSTTVMRTGEPYIIPDVAKVADIVNPGMIRDGVRSALCLPLQAQSRNIGVMWVTYAQPRSFSNTEIKLLGFLARQTSAVIETARLFQEREFLLDTSKMVSSAQDLDQSLQTLAERLVNSLIVTFCRISLLDDTGRILTTRAAYPIVGDLAWNPGIGRRYPLSEAPDEAKAIETGQRQILRQEENPSLLSSLERKTGFQGVLKAAVLIPLTVGRKVFGVITLGERRSWERGSFALERVVLCESAADQVAALIARMRLQEQIQREMQELKHMRRAAEKLASVASVQKVLQQIVRSAKEVLGADSSVIWSYDDIRHTFFPDELVADGIEPELVERFREDEPRRGGTAEIVMKQEYLAVTDIDDPKYTFLGPAARGLRGAIGAKAFQGIALREGNETLGVLYVNYERSQSFSDEDKTTLETFAYHAALALKKARLLEQVSKARDAARHIASVMILEDLPATLESIVKATREVADCDAVTLYAYNQDTDDFVYPPTTLGLRDKKGVRWLDYVDRNSVVWKILALDRPHIAEDAPSDSLMKGQQQGKLPPFVIREAIKSSVGLPLKAGDRKVGVMFVNYRSSHRFATDKLTNIELFANQAAVAIRNAQLYDEVQKRATALQALYEAGRAVTGTLSLDEILRRIVEQAWRLAEPRGKLTHFSHLALVDGNKVRFTTAYPQDVLPKLRAKVGEIDLEHDERIGITGRAVKTGKPQLVVDTTDDRDYIEFDVKVHSQLSVPIKISGQVIGVINVEHPEYNAFDEEDQRALEALAAQAAIAIQNARSYEELKRTKGLVGARTALAWMGMASSAWRHAIDKHALTIREQAQLLRRDLQRSLPCESLARIEERLSMIERRASQIPEKPITPPLSAEEGVVPVPINDLIGERAKQLWQNEPYKSAKLQLDLRLDKAATVRASPEWLRRAFDVLVDNAVDAVDDCDVQAITVGTREAGGGVEIIVSDTGPGIPGGARSKLGLEPIEKPEDARGLGMGLLMAQAIVQTYGGEIRVDSTGPSGTTMVIWLPREK